MNWQSHAIAFLTASLVRPLALAAAGWVVIRIFRARHPASRHAVWTAVLIGMMLLPFVSVIAPHFKLSLPSWKEAPAMQIHAPVPSALPTSEPADFGASRTPNGGGVANAPSARTLVAWVYLSGLFVMIVYRAAGWAMLHRIMSRAEKLRIGPVRESADVLTPVAVGVLRPTVILPKGWRDWSPKTKRAVLAHEFAHLRRHDLLVSALARFARCVFWFHPLAWWVSRKTSVLAEMACDAVALEKLDDPAEYSRILLIFAEAVNHVGHRAAVPGLAMATSSGIGRRIDQVFELSGKEVQKLSRPRVLLSLTGIPIMCIAATAGLSHSSVRTPVISAAPVVARMPSVAHDDERFVSVQQDAEPISPAAVATAPAVERVANSAAVAAEVVQVQSAQTQKKKSQSQDVTPLEFDAASIKPVPAVGRTGPVNFGPGRVFSTNSVTAYRMILAAYHLQEYQLLGGPGWLDSDRFALEAKTQTPASNDQLRLMLQTLLLQRFQLVVHRETREIPVYFLIVGKNGTKLREWKEGDPLPPIDGSSGQGGGFVMHETMEKFTDLLNGIGRGLGIDRPIVDKTGLQGVYVEAVRFDASEDLKTAVEETLGLKFEPRKEPMDVFVVDHIEKPSEN